MKKPINNRFVLPIAWVFLLTTGHAWADDEFVVVDLLVNVLKGVNMTDEKIEKAVEEANKILKQAKIKLEFDKKNNIQRNFNDQGNNNNKIENSEDDKLDKKGVEELEKKFGKGKGFKIMITDEIHGNANTTGLSPHNPDMPVTYLIPREKAGDADRGQTLAHEFAHVFTLGKKHLVDDKNNADPSDDVRADNHGHVNDKKNLMHPTTEGGTDLTEDQKAEINKTAKKRAKTKVAKLKQSTVETIPSAHNSWTHPKDAFLSPVIDLYSGTTFLEHPAAPLQTVINLGGLFPTTPVHVQYAYFFNTDNNNTTGIDGAGLFPGIDKVVFIELSGVYPFTDPSSTIQSQIIDVATDQAQPLPQAKVERIYKIMDFADGGKPKTNDIYDTIHQEIPVESLSLNVPPSQPVIQGGIQSFDFNTDQTDQRPIALSLMPDANLPAMQIDKIAGTFGDTIAVQGERFAPNSNYQLLLDDDVIDTGQVAGNGTVSTSFAFPMLPGGDYFVTVRDDTGKSDFSVFHNEQNLPPVFDVTGLANNPTVLETRLQDADSGIKRIRILRSKNLNTALPDFARGTQNPILFTAEKIDPSKYAQLSLKLIDKTGQTFISDSRLLNLTITEDKPVRSRLNALAPDQSKVRIRNGETGLKRLFVVVNGNVHIMRLSANQETVLDVKEDMLDSNTNTIKLVGRGIIGSSADVAISN